MHKDFRKRLGDLDFELAVCQRYHDRRRQHYERVDTAAKFTPFLGSLIAIGASLSFEEKTVAQLISAGVAVFTGYDLAIGSGKRAQAHVDMQASVVALRADIFRLLYRTQEPTPEEMTDIEVRRINLHVRDEPTMRLVMMISWNEEHYARNDTLHQTFIINLPLRVICGFVNWTNENIKRLDLGENLAVEEVDDGAEAADPDGAGTPTVPGLVFMKNLERAQRTAKEMHQKAAAAQLVAAEAFAKAEQAAEVARSAGTLHIASGEAPNPYPEIPATKLR